MELQEFKDRLYEELKTQKPKNWRDGQFIFNHIDYVFGVARIAQFKYGVDCFYDNSEIDKFIETCYNILKENGKI